MKTAISAIILEEKKILLIKRGDDSSMDPGLWFVPGGRGEENETSNETIIREIEEELGVIFSPQKIFQQIHDRGYEVSKIIGTIEGKITLDANELAGYAWFTYEEAKNLPLAFDMSEVLENLHKKSYI